MKRIIPLLLAFLMLCTCFAGCKKTPPAADATGTNAQKVYGTKLPDQYIVKGGTSEYVLVVPAQPLGNELLAAEEFTHFMQEATGYTFQTVTDDAFTGGKCISLGLTKQFREKFAGEDLSAMDGSYSSYFMVSQDDSIYIACDDTYNGSAVLYGVYDLLEDLIGYHYYHENEIAYTKSADVNLWSYEKHIVSASFDVRTHSTRYIYSDAMRNYRFRYTRFSPSDEWNQPTIGHSQVTMFVSPIDEDPETGLTYGESHPEWFFDPLATTVTKNNNQLCWTAGGDAASREKLLDLCAERMMEYVEMDPESTFFMFGQMDSEFVCQCDGCKAALQEWGGTACGLQIAFVNDLIAKTSEHLAQNGYTQKILYVIYAYKPTEAAPVKVDENGNYVPYSDKVIPHEDMRIFYAPIRTNFAFPFNSSINKEPYAALRGWDAVCDKDQLMTYLYDLNIRYYLANFYNLGTIGAMYQELEDAGVSYMLSQGVSDTWICCFDELRAYCISQLMWDTDQNLGELAADFIDNYYKDAADPIQTLFDRIIEQNAYYVAVKDSGSATPTGILYSPELYPREFVEQMDALIFAAMDAIAYLESTDPAQYELLKARIMKEYLSNIYLKVTLYKSSYSASELKEMEEIWDYYIDFWNITSGGEGQELQDIFA